MTYIAFRTEYITHNLLVKNSHTQINFMKVNKIEHYNKNKTMLMFKETHSITIISLIYIGLYQYKTNSTAWNNDFLKKCYNILNLLFQTLKFVFFKCYNDHG